MQWSPHPAGTAARAAFALLLAAGAFVVDPLGAVLLGGVALGIALDVGYDLVARPRLAARPDGVVVWTRSGRRFLPWEGLRARVRTTSRFGFLTRTLEIDTATDLDGDGGLVVLNRRDLGAPLDVVARDLRALNPTRGA